MFTSTLKFHDGKTHVGDWLASAKLAIALRSVYRELKNMETSLSDSTLYEFLLGLFAVNNRGHFADSAEATKTPETFFATVESLHPDRIDALQALIQQDSKSYRQSETTAFAAHMKANAALYHSHYGRKSLTVGVYITNFRHTHRGDTRGRAFTQAISETLRQLDKSYTTESDEFTQMPLSILYQCCMIWTRRRPSKKLPILPPVNMPPTCKR